MKHKPIKQDINFLEYSLWFQNDQIASKQKDGYTWRDREGFVHHSSFKPPVKIDYIILCALLSFSQRSGWQEELSLTSYEILKECGLEDKRNTYWYNRIRESLRRWLHVSLSFQGTFFDGKTYQIMEFHIIDSWKVEEGTKRLNIRFSKEWLQRIQYSDFWQLIDFEELKALHSPLATRLYELLSKTFRGRSVWQIDAVKLASKIPMENKYPAHIIPKIQTALNRINEKTDLQINLEIKKPKRGKAILTFQKLEANLDTGRESLDNLSQELCSLLAYIPEEHRSKRNIQQVITRYLEDKSEQYVKRNILYTNQNAKKNYRTYLFKALKDDWGDDWWQEVEHDQSKQVPHKQQSLELLKTETKQELEFYSQEFVALRSQEEFEAICSYVEGRLSERKLTTEQFEYERDVLLLSLLKKGVLRYQE